MKDKYARDSKECEAELSEEEHTSSIVWSALRKYSDTIVGDAEHPFMRVGIHLYG